MGGFNGYGSNGNYIRNHKSCRKKSKRLNWFQLAEHETAIANSQLAIPSWRSGRLASWRSRAERFCADTPAIVGCDRVCFPEMMEFGKLVLITPPCKPSQWCVGYVLSCWRVIGKKAKMVHTPLAWSLCHSVRVVILEPDLPDEVVWRRA